MLRRIGCVGRRDTRAGSYDRSLHSEAGEVTLKAPKLRRQTFETAIIQRYQRRESPVEEALIEMYLADVSGRRVEDITEALWGTRVSSGTVSNLNEIMLCRRAGGAVPLRLWKNPQLEAAPPRPLGTWRGKPFLDGHPPPEACGH